MSASYQTETLAEKNPWMDNGELSRDKIREYIVAERAEVDTRMALGEDAALIIDGQQKRITQYLEGWSAENKLLFSTIYSQEMTKLIDESSARIMQQTKTLTDQQNALKASGYAWVIAFSVVLFLFIFIFKR